MGLFFLITINLWIIVDFREVIRRWGGYVTGKVKWFNNEKGYGFVENKNGEDIFVHYSAIIQDGYKTLSEQQMVEFDLIETDKGLQAIHVKVVKEEITV